MKYIGLGDLEDIPVLLRSGGFPGELLPDDIANARHLIGGGDGIPAVIVWVGAETLWWVDAKHEEEVQFEGVRPSRRDGFALGSGDGATLPGIPLDWDLLTFGCPRGDTTVLLARVPNVPPRCVIHDLPLQLRETGP